MWLVDCMVAYLLDLYVHAMVIASSRVVGEGTSGSWRSSRWRSTSRLRLVTSSVCPFKRSKMLYKM